MKDIPKGLLAGLAATIILSVLMVPKAMMGLMPQLDLPKMIAGMMGSPDQPLIGWIVHFMIGIVIYGVAIAALDSKLPGTSRTLHGIMLGAIGWLIMMLVLMPMAGAGLFGINMGMMAPMMTLVLYVIFGAVLGCVWTLGCVARRVEFTGSRLIRLTRRDSAKRVGRAMHAIAHDPQCIPPVDLNERLLDIQPICLQRAKRTSSMRPICSTLPNATPCYGKRGSDPITTMSYGSSRCGRDSSGSHSEKQ